MARYTFKSALCSISMALPLLAVADQSSDQMPALLPGNPIKDQQIPAAYPHSAAYDVGGWDVFLSADYICWRWNQPLSPVSLVSTTDSLVVDQFVSKSSTIVDLNPHYTSGFQVGLGFNMKGMDNWNLYSEYTWYRNTVNGSLDTGPDQSFTRVLAGSQFSVFNQEGTFTSKAKMHFDALDVSLQRPFYLGQRIVASWNLGLSNLWITQKINLNYDVQLERFEQEELIFNMASVNAKQTSWGIGPKMEFDTNWLLGYGIKLIGNLSASILYTKYIWNAQASSLLSGTIPTETIHSSFSRTHGTYNFLPVTETSFGIGWGSYLANNSFHFDLSVLYDINVYWNYTNLALEYPQNMMLHGLNVQARFDF